MDDWECEWEVGRRAREWVQGKRAPACLARARTLASSASR